MIDLIQPIRVTDIHIPNTNKNPAGGRAFIYQAPPLC